VPRSNTPPALPAARRSGRRADLLIAGVTAVVLLGAALYAALFGSTLVTLTASALLGSGVAVLCWVPGLPPRARGTLLAMAGMVAVGILIHAARGRPESHFAVFVFLAFLLVYRDWVPIVAAAFTVAIHHGLFNYLQQWGWGPICFTEPGIAAVIEHLVYVVIDATLLAILAVAARREMANLFAFDLSAQKALARIRATAAALGEDAFSVQASDAAAASSATLPDGGDRTIHDSVRLQTGLLVKATGELGKIAAARERSVRQRTGELQRAHDEAVAASRAKSAFLANMSHEIRTPLTSIIGFAELLLQPNSSPMDPRVSLNTIIRNGRHLLDVINDILDVAKIETEQVEIERIDLALPTLLRDLNALVSGRAQERSLEFIVVPHLPLPSTLRTDPVRLKQILLNFCSNAIKFTPRGSVTLEVGYAAEPPALWFAVTDTGIGMTEEQIGRLFRPFMQADVSTTRQHGGTGLGLYISQQLAGLLGGRVGVKSTPGRGSRFELELKLPQALPPHELLTLEGDLIDYERTEFLITSVSIPELSGRVLLAEDGLDNQRLISAYLGQAGLAVSVAHNGREAVEQALADDYDLVLMDVQMPAMDGITATRTLRAVGYTRPIVALTANVMREDLERYRAAGCNDVLAKPIDRDRFYETVARHLGSEAAAGSAVDDEAFARELQDLKADFEQALPAQGLRVRDALRTRDWKRLSALAHTLRGTAGSFGHPRLTEAAAAVENSLRDDRIVQAAQQCERLLREIDASTTPERIL
jgi:signal transduction histidine kinase/CheY-like chemotaxis protein/HPt (histidine-containing phosphotransfer) domain-containing protein